MDCRSGPVPVEIAPSVGRVESIAGGVKVRCARPSGAALDTAGFGGPGRPTETSRGKAACVDIGLNTGALPRTPGLAAGPSRYRPRLHSNILGYPFDACSGAIQAASRFIVVVIGSVGEVDGRLMYDVVSSSGLDRPRTNRSGCASYAASRVALRMRVFSSTRPWWTSDGVRSAIPLCRCSLLYQA